MDEKTFLQMAYNNCQDVVKMIDQKITVLIAVLTILAAVTVSFANDLGDAWLSIQPSAAKWCLAAWLLVAGLSMLASLFCGGVALYPRRPKKIPFKDEEAKDPHLGSMFWAHGIVSYETYEDYLQAVRAAPDDLRSAEIAYETMAVSDILVKKFPWSRRATIFFLIALTMLGIAVIFMPWVHSQVAG